MDGSGLSMYHECIEQIMKCTDEGEVLLQALAAVGFAFKYDERGALLKLMFRTFRDNEFTCPVEARLFFIETFRNCRGG